jgi:hypothetical protein
LNDKSHGESIRNPPFSNKRQAIGNDSWLSYLFGFVKLANSRATKVCRRGDGTFGTVPVWISGQTSQAALSEVG